VAVECDHPEVSGLIEGYLAPYRSEDDFGEGVRISLRSGEVHYPVPLHASRVFRYGSYRMYMISETAFYTDYFSTLTVEKDGKEVRGNVDPRSLSETGPDLFANVLFSFALFDALRHHGLFYLHAAALSGPDGTGYLVCGNAGSGKTTLTLALVKSGYKYLSDDSVFLRLCEGEGVEVLGFEREFHLPVELAASVCGADAHSLPAYSLFHDKRKLKAGEWFPGRCISSIRNPSVLIFPKISENGSELEALPVSEALTMLLPQSPGVMFDKRLARPHLEALKRVLHHGRAFKIASGPELKNGEDAARKMFESARDMARRDRS